MLSDPKKTGQLELYVAAAREAVRKLTSLSAALAEPRWSPDGTAIAPWVIASSTRTACPVPQSYEFWHALKTLGIPTQLVVYPGEGRAFREPGHRKDSIRRAVAWFDQNLKGGSR